MSGRPSPGTTGGTASRHLRIAFWLAILLSSALIIAAARGDLWFDELLSLSFARTSRSIADIFVRLHYDNNHPLNTVFLHWVGVHESLFIYRSLAVLSGIGSLLLVAYLAGRSWGSREALCSLVLTGTSYPLLLYFSEARGYAPAIFFALAAYALLQENQRCFHPARMVLFWAASILGVLSHATFIMATLAFCLGSLVQAIPAPGSWKQKSLRFAAHHGPPLVFFAWWNGFFLRDLVVVGGPIYPKWEVLAQASELLLGFPDGLGFAGVAMACVLGLVAAGVVGLLRARDTRWGFFLAMLCVSPAVLLFATRPVYLYFRYFILCFPFFYLLLARVICEWFRAWPNWGRWLLAAAVAMMVAGQAPRVGALISLGRGSYSRALARIAKCSPQEVVYLGGDHDFRNHLLFAFYAPRVPGGSRLHYIERPHWNEYPPDWFILESQDLAYQPPRELAVNDLGKYQLADEYRYSGISGWGWFVLRRETSDGRTEKGKAE